MIFLSLNIPIYAFIEEIQVEKQDDNYSSDHNAKTLDSQHSQLLQIVFYYSKDHVDKQAYYTSFFTSYEVLKILFATFLALKKLLVSGTL